MVLSCCPFSFWLAGSFMALIIWSAKTCALGPPRPLSSSVPAEAGRLLVCALPGHQCIWFRGEPVSSYFSMAYYSVVSYWCKWCMLITISTTCLDVGSNAWEISAWKPPWRQCTLFVCSNFKPLWHKVLLTCTQLILVSWYVARKLCCHCWVFSLCDALPMQSYPSLKYGYFVSAAVRHNLFL